MRIRGVLFVVARLLMGAVLYAVPFTVTAETYPPLDKKFVAYGDVQKLHTELKGSVMAIEGSNLFVKPDTGYMNLAIEGNRRRPKPGEEGAEFYSSAISTTDTVTVMKLETYTVGTWPDSGGSDIPTVVDNGVRRPLRVGDHVNISGLYVTDNAHTMFAPLCTDSFSYMRGTYRACYAHTELHPYDHSNVELVPALVAGSTNVEKHTVVAPIYPEYYSHTYWWNKVGGVAAQLVEATKQETSSTEWHVEAPPLPIGGVEGKTHFLKIEENILFNPNDMPVHQISRSGNGYKVSVSVRGSDINNPALFQATYKVYWAPIENGCIQIIHTGTTGNAFGQTHDQIKRFQTFLASDDQPIVGIDIKVRKLPGANHSDIVVELYDSNGHVPTGSPLACATIAASSVGSEWTIVNAPLQYPKMVFEREYAVVLSQRTPGPALYEWTVSPVNKATSFGKWNGVSWVNESGLGDGWLKVWVMPRYLASTVDITHSGGRGNGFGNLTDEVKRYQTFSLPETATVIGVDLKLRKYNGSAQNDIAAELYATSGNRPTGSPLASGTLSASHVGGDWTIVHVPIKSRPLAAGMYAIVLSQRSLSPARYEWAVGQVSGSTAFGKWNGSSWIDESGLGDGWTRVWTTDADTDVDISHAATTGNGFGNSVDEIKRFQTFIAPTTNAGDAYDLNGVQLKLRKYNGSDQSDVIVELYETVGNKPTGFAKATAVIASSCIGTDWTIVTVPLYYKCDWLGRGIVPGKEYAIVLSQRHPHSARYEWAAGNVSSSLQFGKWNGSSWIDESGLGDGWLKVSLIMRVGPN